MLCLMLRLARQPFAALPRLFFLLFQSQSRPLLLLLTLAARLLLLRLPFLLTPRFLGSGLLQGVGALPLERGRAFTDERLETRIARRNPETVVQETESRPRLPAHCAPLSESCRVPLPACGPPLRARGFLPGVAPLRPVVAAPPRADSEARHRVARSARGSADRPERTSRPRSAG